MQGFDPSRINRFSTLFFSPDPLSRFQHEQIYGTRRHPVDQGIRALMLAVLEDGIFCFQNYFLKPSRSNQRLSREAEEWITAREEGIFSFDNICDTLELNHERLRKDLLQWKAKQFEEGQQIPAPSLTRERRGSTGKKRAA